MLIWLLTFVVGLGGFAHCIATSGEILAAILDHQLAAAPEKPWSVHVSNPVICASQILA